MSFANKGNNADMQFTQLFWFNTYEMPKSDEEEIFSAELRLYKEAVSPPAHGDHRCVSIARTV